MGGIYDQVSLQKAFGDWELWKNTTIPVHKVKYSMHPDKWPLNYTVSAKIASPSVKLSILSSLSITHSSILTVYYFRRFCCCFQFH